MRLRRIPGTKEALTHYEDLVIMDPESNKGRWREFFGNDHPIHVELGMGKGQFISTLAAQHPEINYIGMEFREEMVHIAAKKMGNHRGNVALLWFNVDNILEIFNPGELSRIYLNFSDPWPKKRHGKRRLTYRNYLAKYKKLFDNAGEIHFKTDNKDLFEFSLNEFGDSGFFLKNITLDLHNSEFKGNVLTEYEKKFSQKGMPIYRCEAIYRK